jgi:hypothetical protein
MGTIKKHPPVQLFMAVTFNPVLPIEDILAKIEQTFGPIEDKTSVFDFDAFTDYYEKEMGKGLKKFFVTFYDLIEPEDFPEIKVRSNQLEKEISGQDKRKVNIDPGYLNLSKVVLATTKDYSHRLYLGQGIFGDLHLVFINKTFRQQPWTYPDYQQDWVIAFFNRLRTTYREKLGEYLSQAI